MRIRTIKPEFFTHEGIFEAEQETGLPLRIAFQGLWCAADREGRFRWEPRRLGVAILPYDGIDFSRVLHALATRGFLVKYRVGDAWFGCIPSFRRHQVINPREAASQIPDVSDAEEVNDACPTRAPRVPHASTTRDVLARGEGKGKEGKGKDSSRPDSAAPTPDGDSPPASPKDPHPNPEAEVFVDWFLALLAETGAPVPKLTSSSRHGWADAFDKLLRIDGKTADQVHRVCRWARNDQFWRGNFMSPAKLREKRDGVSYCDYFLNKMSISSSGIRKPYVPAGLLPES